MTALAGSLGTTPISSRDQAELSSSSTLLLVVGDQAQALHFIGRLDVNLRTVAGANPLGDLPESTVCLLVISDEPACLDLGAKRHQLGEVDPRSLAELAPQLIESGLNRRGLGDRVAGPGGRHAKSVAPCCTAAGRQRW